MPCILKERTEHSPGIVSFTQNETFWGVPAQWRRARDFLIENARDGKWLFGTHVQGDLNWLPEWPLQPWESFVLWPDAQAKFLANVPMEMRPNLSCINFMPSVDPRPEGMARNVDICVISRPSSIKRIHETLLLLRRLFDIRPDLTVTIIAGDPRRVELGSNTYSRQGIDRRFFEFAEKNLSSRELTRMSFLSTSEQAFGRFPLARELVNDVLRRARFLLLTSHQEGTPRVIAEAFLNRTPCILSKHLRSGIRSQTNDRNTLFIGDDIATAAAQIDDALSHYDRFDVDVEAMRRVFGAEFHIPQLRDWFSARISAMGKPVEGRWFLEDLHLRLACHAQRRDPQIMNREKLFFAWFDQVNAGLAPGRVPFDPYDEDAMFGGCDPDDRPRGLQRPGVKRVHAFTARVLRKLGLKIA